VLSLFDRAVHKDAAAILRPAGTCQHMHAVAVERNVL
jgi:hypothetical protein